MPLCANFGLLAFPERSLRGGPQVLACVLTSVRTCVVTESGRLAHSAGRRGAQSCWPARRTRCTTSTPSCTALAQAVDWDDIAVDVSDGAATPSVPHKKPHWPTSHEVTRPLATANEAEDRLRAIWTVAADTGMRQGELLGLTWEHVDLAAGELHVRQTPVKVKAQEPTFSQPKTTRSRRTVPLTDDAVVALRAHRARQNEQRLALNGAYGSYGLVFATQIGTPLASQVVQMSFKRALKRAGVDASIHFHDLWRAAASMMLASGVDMPTVAAILGHSRNSTTLDIYAHAVP
jgi:integrase